MRKRYSYKAFFAGVNRVCASLLGDSYNREEIPLISGKLESCLAR